MFNFPDTDKLTSNLLNLSGGLLKGTVVAIGGFVSLPFFYLVFDILIGLLFRQRHYNHISTALAYVLLGCGTIMDIIIGFALRKRALVYRLIFMMSVVLTFIACILIIMFSDMSIVD